MSQFVFRTTLLWVKFTTPGWSAWANITYVQGSLLCLNTIYYIFPNGNGPCPLLSTSPATPSHSVFPVSQVSLPIRVLSEQIRQFCLSYFHLSLELPDTFGLEPKQTLHEGGGCLCTHSCTSVCSYHTPKEHASSSNRHARLKTWPIEHSSNLSKIAPRLVNLAALSSRGSQHNKESTYQLFSGHGCHIVTTALSPNTHTRLPGIGNVSLQPECSDIVYICLYPAISPLSMLICLSRYPRNTGFYAGNLHLLPTHY